VWAATDGISLAAVGYAVKRLNRKLQPAKVPLMAVVAALIFAAQMINIPVPGLPRVSGHPLGGLLAAVLLGPLEASVIMSVVFVVQALIFQDGGLVVLGANMLNMGLAATLGGYGLYALLRRCSGNATWRAVALFAAAWCSVELGALLTGVELLLSRGTVPLPSSELLLGALLTVHAFIGLGEGAITVAAVRLIAGSRPDLLFGESAAPEGEAA